LNQVSDWEAGDQLTVEVKRNQHTVKLQSVVKGRPLERSSYGHVIYDHVHYDGGKLRTITTIPVGVSDPPYLLFMQGIGCASIDYYYNDQSTVKLLLDEFVKHGIAVMRVEKPGMGDSKGHIPCEKMGYDYEVGGFEAALNYLLSQDGIQHDRVFLFGESLSSISVPVLAKKYNVGGAIVWGGLSKSWFEYSIKLLKDQKYLLEVDPAEIEKKYEIYLPFYYDFLINKAAPDELKSKNQYETFVNDFFIDDMWLGLHHYSYFHELNDEKILSNYAIMESPVLCMAGGHDIHTVDTKWAQEILFALRPEARKHSDILIFPKTTHHYFEVNSLVRYVNLLKSKELTGSFMSNNFNSMISKKGADWIKMILNE